eukprot:5210008-Amphidinium_carterae.1
MESCSIDHVVLAQFRLVFPSPLATRQSPSDEETKHKKMRPKLAAKSNDNQPTERSYPPAHVLRIAKFVNEL